MAWDQGFPGPCRPDDVPEEDLQTMLTLAAQAPSSFNLQPWRFVVVRERQQRDRLSRAVRHHDSVAGAPVVVVAYGRREERMQCADEIFGAASRDREDDENARLRLQVAASDFVRDQPAVVWLTRQVMVAFTYLMIAAEALGWNTAPMEDFDSAAVGAVLGLPADAEVVALLAIGRRHSEPALPPRRLPLEKLISNEHHGVPWCDRASSRF
jgi:nitroreductase